MPPTEAQTPPGSAAADEVHAWSEAWVARARCMEADLASRPLPAIRMVQDGAHREWLWTALAQARRRLVVTSDRLSAEAVSGRMIEAIRALLEREVAVTVIHASSE